MKCAGLGRLTLSLSFVLFGAYALASSQGAGYHLLKKVPLAAAPGGGEYFDYITVDPDGRRVYVSHGTEVQVLDADRLTVVGTIGGLKRCHGVAVVKKLGKGFITDSDSQSVVIFDLATLKVTGEVKTNQPPDSIIYDPASKHIVTFNGHSHNMTVIDPVKQTVLKDLDLVGAVEQPVADGKGMIYDNNLEKNDVVVIESRDIAVKARWPVAPAGMPFAIAMDRKNRRLFSAGRDPQMLVMMDADKGNVIQSFSITAGVDALQFDPGTAMVFASTREGMIHVFHEDTPEKLSEVETVKTEYGAKTMGLDPKTHNLYLPTSDFDPPDPPTEKQPHPTAKAKPGNFRLLVYTR